jgi:hypothetical protein
LKSSIKHSYCDFPEYVHHHQTVGMSTTCTWVQIGNNDYEALMQAVVEDDVQRIAAALKPNIDVDAMYGDGTEGETLLHSSMCGTSGCNTDATRRRSGHKRPGNRRRDSFYRRALEHPRSDAKTYRYYFTIAGPWRRHQCQGIYLWNDRCMST